MDLKYLYLLLRLLNIKCRYISNKYKINKLIVDIHSAGTQVELYQSTDLSGQRHARDIDLKDNLRKRQRN